MSECFRLSVVWGVEIACVVRFLHHSCTVDVVLSPTHRTYLEAKYNPLIFFRFSPFFFSGDQNQEAWNVKTWKSLLWGLELADFNPTISIPFSIPILHGSWVPISMRIQMKLVGFKRWFSEFFASWCHPTEAWAGTSLVHTCSTERCCDADPSHKRGSIDIWFQI